MRERCLDYFILFNILSRSQHIVRSVVSFIRIYCLNNHCRFVPTNLLLSNFTAYSYNVLSIDSYTKISCSSTVAQMYYLCWKFRFVYKFAFSYYKSKVGQSTSELPRPVQMLGHRSYWRTMSKGHQNTTVMNKP